MKGVLLFEEKSLPLPITMRLGDIQIIKISVPIKRDTTWEEVKNVVLNNIKSGLTERTAVPHALIKSITKEDFILDLQSQQDDIGIVADGFRSPISFVSEHNSNYVCKVILQQEIRKKIAKTFPEQSSICRIM